MTTATSPTHAIVLGGSMAGLLAARVLSDSFDRVTIIERDRLPEAPDYRAGVPQGRHLHTLLVKGLNILTELFPDIEAELDATGAPRLHWGLNTCLFTTGGRTPKFDTGLHSYSISRTTLEWVVRNRVRQIAHIDWLEETVAENLLHENGRVTGVFIKGKRAGELQLLRADFVVDASGRTSKTPEWLVALGYPQVKETVVNGNLGYATRWFKVSHNPLGDVDAIGVQAHTHAGHYRAGGFFRVEGNQFIVTLSGGNMDYPPTDEAGFLEFARTLSTPHIYELICNNEPISPIYGYRRTENRQLHYDELSHRPENFIVMGDAACAFNPIFGQGMTVAAMEADILARLLKGVALDNLDGIAEQFQTAVAALIQGPWQLATSEDLRYPTTVAEDVGPVIRSLRRYFDWLAYGMAYDRELTLRFVRIQNLLAPSTLLFTPSTAARVLWQRIRMATRPKSDFVPQPSPQPLVKPSAS